MNPYIAELIGTTILVLLGNGVVANVVLANTKGHDSGWVVITLGWGFAVYTAVLCVAEYSGAHINPAVTISLAVARLFAWNLVPGYLAAQMAGGILGGTLVYLVYRAHYAATENPDSKLATFCTSPAIRGVAGNLFSEAVGTFVLVFAVLLTSNPTFQISTAGSTEPVEVGLGSIGALRVGFVVLTIGLCLGGTTGYAINPARDLGPRIAHALLPIPGKRDSDWSYAWIPVVGPLIGGIAAAFAFMAIPAP
ncbi:MAG: aquaporin family protein [Planctomycetaceae bacterium]|nr:aquaporin family protein [Planctomycetaceae bacterium]